jgi:predicted transglutaminase-like cysteine proteinase
MTDSSKLTMQQRDEIIRLNEAVNALHKVVDFAYQQGAWDMADTLGNYATQIEADIERIWDTTK